MVKARNVTIKTKMNGGQIEFEMEENGNYTEMLLFNKSDDKIKKTDSYDIIFNLQNGAGVNLEFVQDVGNVMYVRKGSPNSIPKCPTNAAGNSQTPFTVTSVTATTLTVHNPDDDICFYKFALRFINKNANNAIETFDPIYGNQNGGTSVSSSAYLTAVVFVCGVALGSVVTMMTFNVGLFA